MDDGATTGSTTGTTTDPAKPTAWPQMLAVILTAIALLWPLAAISDLIEERALRATVVAHEIGASWGGSQTLLGPLLVLPVRRPPTAPIATQPLTPTPRSLTPTPRASTQPSPSSSTAPAADPLAGWIMLLPETLDADLTIDPVEKQRGAFATTLAESTITLDAAFALDRVDLRPGEWIDWDGAAAHVAFGPLAGLVGEPELTWNGTPSRLEPATVHDLGETLAAPRPDAAARPATEADEIRIGVRSTVRGTGAVHLVPSAAETRVTARSAWPDPSFEGTFLPRQHEITSDGFVARWTVSRLAHGLPLVWRNGLSDSAEASFRRTHLGVRLAQTVGFYQRVQRCTKYAVLFIGLVFGLVALQDLLGGLRLHPVPYLLVGLALAIFYLLLLALAERIGFTTAYVLASSATTGLIGAYVASILRSLRRAAAVAAPITVLFGLLYVLVRLEHLALLVGSIALFTTLGVAMWATRRVDWNRVLPVGALPFRRRGGRPEETRDVAERERAGYEPAS